MAQATVLAVGAAFIVAGLVGYAKLGDANLGWIVAGVAAIIVGMATKNMKL